MNKTYKPYRLIYTGKTKDTFSVKNKPDVFIMRFKNNILGRNGVPDSGGNEVIGSVPGKGNACACISGIFLELFKKYGIATHLIKKNHDGSFAVKKTQRIPIEFICRNKAYGSYLERFPRTKKFKPLGGILEFSLKSDEAGDPFLSKKQVLDFIGKKEIAHITAVISKVNKAASALCKKMGIELADFKVEFGRQGKRIILIDDFSTDTARFFCGEKLLTCFNLLKHFNKKTSPGFDNAV